MSESLMRIAREISKWDVKDHIAIKEVESEILATKLINGFTGNESSSNYVPEKPISPAECWTGTGRWGGRVVEKGDYLVGHT